MSTSSSSSSVVSSSAVRPAGAAAWVRGLPLLVAAGVLWGTGGPAGAVLQSAAGIHPLGTAAYRMLAGGVLACLVLLVLGRLRRVPRTRAAMVRVGVAGVLLAVFQSCYFAAIAFTSVSLATLVTIGSVPVFVTVGVAVPRRCWPAPRLVVAVLLAIGGLTLLAGSPGTAGSVAETTAGVGCALTAGAAFATLTLVSQRPVPGLDPLAVTSLGLLLGGVLLLPFGVVVGMAFAPTAVTLGAFAYLATIPTALAYLAYFQGVGAAAPTAAALAVLLEPLTATLLGVLLLDESLTGAGVVGAVLLVTALVLDQYRPRRGHHAKPQVSSAS